jgi:hypothetical protein
MIARLVFLTNINKCSILSIKARLLEMGYVEADMYQLPKLAVVAKDKELTDRSEFVRLAFCMASP